MKLKLLEALLEKLLGEKMDDSTPRGDMYMPVKLLAMALALLIGAVVFGVMAALDGQPIYWVLVVLFGGLGIGAVLCWRNQKIHVLDENTFEYITFLGRKKQLAFADIRALRRNRDSMTLFVGDEKVHIESGALMTQRLMDKLNEALNGPGEEEPEEEEA